MLLHTQKFTRNTVETFLEPIEVEGHNYLICSGENTKIYWYCSSPQNVRRFQNFRSFIWLIYSFLMIEITRSGYLKASPDFNE